MNKVIVMLVAFLIIPQLSFCSDYDEYTSLTNTLLHMRYVINNKFTNKDIENFINKGIEKGAINYRLVYPKIDFLQTNDMGWAIDDSKGREVFRVIFSFGDDNIVKDGKYLGPIISTDMSNDIYTYHINGMSKNYNKINQNSYDLGDGCIGNIELQKMKNNIYKGRYVIGSETKERTVITVQCLKR